MNRWSHSATALRAEGNPKSDVRRPPRPAFDIAICHLKASGSVCSPRRGARYETALGLIKILLSLVLRSASILTYSSTQRVAGCERWPRCVVWPIAAFPFARQGTLLPTWQAPLTCPLHAAVSHFQTMLHCQRRPRQPPTAHSRVRPRNLTLSPPLPLRSLTVAPLQSLQRCDGETTER